MKGAFALNNNAPEMSLSAGLAHLGELPAYGVAKVLGAYAFVGTLPTVIATLGIAGVVDAIRNSGTKPENQSGPTLDKSPEPGR